MTDLEKIVAQYKMFISLKYGDSSSGLKPRLDNTVYGGGQKDTSVELINNSRLDSSES